MYLLASPCRLVLACYRLHPPSPFIIIRLRRFVRYSISGVLVPSAEFCVRSVCPSVGNDRVLWQSGRLSRGVVWGGESDGLSERFSGLGTRSLHGEWQIMEEIGWRNVRYRRRGFFPNYIRISCKLFLASLYLYRYFETRTRSCSILIHLSYPGSEQPHGWAYTSPIPPTKNIVHLLISL